MANDRYLKAVIPFVCLFGLTACQTGSKTPGSSLPQAEHWPTAEEQATWLKHEGLAEATAGEIAIAGAGEIRFEGHKAFLPNKEFSVVFKMGTLHAVGEGGSSGPQTTTSFYALKNIRSGNTEARIASSLSDKLGKELGYKQKIWISQNERRLLIYETWCDGAGYHDMVALISSDMPNGKSWSVKYLKLPEFNGYPGINDHGATPVGFVGDDLLFKPLAPDKICKKNLDDIEEAWLPVPFTIG